MIGSITENKPILYIFILAVWLCGTAAFVSINVVILCLTRSVLGWVTSKPSRFGKTSHPGQLSLAIPPWVGAISPMKAGM